MIEKFLTTEQVANILQVHPFTILKFIKNGKLEGVKLGRMYRIKESAVHNFLEKMATENKHEPTSAPIKKASEQKVVINRQKGEEDEHYYII
ncbi:helix-turn-helix domain-containing protein [Patescibacteria group bacterium]|nr:helix-turn-helix domain-containing protein [Patescibacteria group bacterium]